MARRRIPSYRHYKPKNLGLVVLDGHYHYLGKYGTPTSLAEYHRLIQEWLAGRPGDPETGTSTTPNPSVDDVFVAFWKFAETHYRKPSGEQTGELDNLRHALRPVHRLYGHTAARDFGPLALRAVRDQMIQSGLGRTTINDRINRVRRAFKWAVGVELIPPSVSQALQAVGGLQRGRTEAREPEPVKPVPFEHVEAALPHMPRPVAAMVRLQLLTGCRASEVMTMRGGDLGMDGPVWTYTPRWHKNQWRGQGRVIYLGPQAQGVLRDFLKPDRETYLFSPREYVESARLLRAEQRRSKRTPSELARGRKERPVRQPGLQYNRRSFRLAINRACRKAGVPPWSPLSLRHASATAIRARFGVEAAQVVLGHARCEVTQLYAEKNMTLARRVAAEVG